MQAISGYEHFKSDGCKVFDDREVEQWNAMQRNQRNVWNMNMLGMNNVPQDERPINCPMCGQLNGKIGGNNNLR
jgi:hypothetical protein